MQNDNRVTSMKESNFTQFGDGPRQDQSQIADLFAGADVGLALFDTSLSLLASNDLYRTLCGYVSADMPTGTKLQELIRMTYKRLNTPAAEIDDKIQKIIDRLQPALNKFTSADAFIKHYAVTDEQLNNFVVYVSRSIKEINSKELLVSKPTIKTILKAFTARFKWGDNAYFEILNNDDVTLKKAIESIN